MRAKRTGNSCCGMEYGRIYEVEEDGYYYIAKLDDGTWTDPHFKGFEIVRDEPSPTASA